METFQRVVTAVGVATGQTPQGHGTQRKALCPVHDDENASLSIRIDDGRVRINCFAGCEFEDILAAIGLDARQLIIGGGDSHSKTNGHKPSGKKPREREQSKGAPKGSELERYPYVDEAGDVLYFNVRFEPKDFRMADATGKIGPLPKNIRRVPYNLPAVIEAVAAGRTIYWVEGERDVHSLTARGEVGTTNAGGANSPLDPAWAEYFQNAHVVVVCDRDKPGRSYGRAVARLLVNSVERLEITQSRTPQEKSDLSDHLASGYELRQLEPLAMRSVRRTRWSVAQIMDTVPEPMRWVLPGVIPEGLTLLVGAPKAGKSWWNIDLMVALGSGRPDQVFEWGQQIEPSANLYLALEDPQRRVHSRMHQVSKGIRFPKHTAGDVWLDLPPIDEGGREEIEQWLDRNQGCRVVLVDVLAKVRGTPKESQGLYQADYAAITLLKEIADDYGIGVIVTHHDRKKTDEDFMNMVSGTKGVTGAADTILYLTRDRGSTEGLLRCESRDVEECQYPMDFDRATGRWKIMRRDDAGSDPDNSAQTLIEKICQTLLAMGYGTAAQIAEVIGVNPEEIALELQRAKRDGIVAKRADGSWRVPQKR